MKIYTIFNFIVYLTVIGILLSKKQAVKRDSLDNMLFRLVMLIFIGWICLTGFYTSIADLWSQVSPLLNYIIYGTITQ